MGNWTPSIIRGGNSETVYLVADDFGDLGFCWRATVGETELETVIVDLLRASTAIRFGLSASTPLKAGPATSRGRSQARYNTAVIGSGVQLPANLEGSIERHLDRDRAQLRLV
jgi:hypothetical protein